jgi:hypothetical protein
VNWREATLAVWAVLAVLPVALQTIAVSTRRLPTAGDAVRRLTTSRLSRGAVLVYWMWLGWHAFAR